MVQATFLAQAYRHDKGATVDAGNSASALRGWTSYDLDDSPDPVKAWWAHISNAIIAIHWWSLTSQGYDSTSPGVD